MAFQDYALQYSNVDVQEVLDSNVDLFITEGGPETNFVNSKITADELTSLQANGTQVVGYINVSVTDDTRPYWDASWTDDGTDTGIPTSTAPAWLADQPANDFGYVVDYTDTGWQDVVIAQAVDLVSSGFDGVFMDDFQQYYVEGATGLTISENATAMMEFAVKIDKAIKAVNPNAVLISNGNPYVVTDGVGGATSTEAINYLEAIDGMLLEIFFGIIQTEEAAIEQAKTYILPSTNVLAIEYGGTDYQNYLFEQAAAKAGILAFAASDASYSDFGTSADATDGDDNLLGTGLGDRIAAYEGNDTITAGGGNDIVRGDQGADSMDGGEGLDYLNYIKSDEGVTVDLSTGTGAGGDAEGDTFTGFERILGSTFDDVLTGDSGNNVVRGDAGADAMEGGTGIDWVSYVNSAEAVTVDLGTETGSGGDADGDKISGFERICGSQFDDILTGDSGNNVIVGGGGADALDGGEGIDYLSFGASSAGVVVDLGAGTGSGGDAQGDTYQGFERIFGSNFADMLTGDAGDNYFIGNDGSDTINGSDGSDVVLYKATQAEFIIENSAAGEWTVIETATGYIDTLSEIETLRFSDGTIEDTAIV